MNDNQQLITNAIERQVQGKAEQGPFQTEIPYYVTTKRGETFCICTTMDEAQTICDALNGYELALESAKSVDVLLPRLFDDDPYDWTEDIERIAKKQTLFTDQLREQVKK